MQSRRDHRRLLLPAIAAIAVVVAASGSALAIGPRPASNVGAIRAAGPSVAGAVSSPAPFSRPASDGATGKRATSSLDRLREAPARVASADPVGSRMTTPTAQVAPAKSAVARPTANAASSTSGGAVAYRGRNHVWIPSLGINRAVEFFPCPRTKPPGHQIYSWGCAGRNNVYLFGHAASVMKPLHDAYYSKRLKVGMKAVYADGNGVVRTYKVAYWKVVSPVDAGWAFAAQSRPSMTLQTCVGAQSQWRLVVRLVQSG